MKIAFIHAHPDDETLATGALIAWLVTSGHEVSLLTATRGERGEVVPGPLSHLAGTRRIAQETVTRDPQNPQRPGQFTLPVGLQLLGVRQV